MRNESVLFISRQTGDHPLTGCGPLNLQGPADFLGDIPTLIIGEMVLSPEFLCSLNDGAKVRTTFRVLDGVRISATFAYTDGIKWN
jgi:hypothetical protein